MTGTRGKRRAKNASSLSVVQGATNKSSNPLRRRHLYLGVILNEICSSEVNIFPEINQCSLPCGLLAQPKEVNSSGMDYM